MTISVNFENLGKTGNLGTKSRDVPSKVRCFIKKLDFPPESVIFYPKVRLSSQVHNVCAIYTIATIWAVFLVSATQKLYNLGKSRKIFNVLENLGNLGKSEKI